VVVEFSELQLVWPADLFAWEAQALLDAGEHDQGSLGWLLDEAFYDGRGLKIVRRVRFRLAPKRRI